MSKPISKTKAKRLRKAGAVNAPSPKVGHGHVTYKGAGVHADKVSKAERKQRQTEKKNHRNGDFTE